MQTIHCRVAIWDAEYSIKTNCDGSVTVRAPYEKHTRNGSTLGYRLCTLSGDDATAAKMFFAESELCLPANNGVGALTLNDVLKGNRYPGVMPDPEQPAKGE